MRARAIRRHRGKARGSPARMRMSAATMSDPIDLRLFVAGSTGASELAQQNLEAVLQAAAPGQYRLEIVDVLKNPALAMAENVLVTPTLICIRNGMRSIMIGDLGNLDRLRAFIAR
jgi:circadian clock protein KaiB